MRQLARERMLQKNAELKAKIASTGAATDNDVSDDATGVARRAAAKASRQRKAEEAAQLAQENADLFGMIRSTGAATDNDVSDDALGESRRRVAIEAKLRKDAEKRQLAAQNALHQGRLDATGAATDNDVSDDATGAARQAVARAAATHKAQASAALSEANAELGQRLGAVGAPSLVMPKVSTPTLSTPKEKKKRTSRTGAPSKEVSPATEKLYITMPPGAAPACAPQAETTALPAPPPMLARSRTKAKASADGKGEARGEAPRSFRPDLELKRPPTKLDIERDLQMQEWLEQLQQEAKAAGVSEYDTPRLW